MKKISVIIPVYNVENYIQKSVSSVLNQTYQNLEIILVDDGSTDNSGKICDEFAKKDTRVQVIHKKNGGLSSARNAGMKVATGERIAFLDSDDCIISNFYEYLSSLLDHYDADIAEGEFLRISAEDMQDTENILRQKNSQIPVKETVCNYLQALKTLYGISQSAYVKKVVVWNKLYKREVLEKITFPEGRLHEDEFTTHQILYYAPKIVSSNQYIHGYIQSKNSIMRKEISMKRVQDTLESSIAALKFFMDKNLEEIEAKIMMRYLSHCIELSAKIKSEKSKDREEKLNYMDIRFSLFYENNIEFIKEHITGALEKQYVNVLKEAYKTPRDNFELASYWENLKQIMKENT